MTNSDKEFLFQFGWDSFFEKHITDLATSSGTIARVISEERNLYRLQAGINLSYWASVSGKIQHAAVSRASYPAVGDWVMVERLGQSERGTILQVIPRKTTIQRKQAGTGSDIQILSTNVDTIFITCSLNEDLNFRRIERYLTMARESGATPVVLLTKADLSASQVEQLAQTVRVEFPLINVHTLSKESFDHALFFSDYLKTGKTAVVVGSSGVGKSTLVNHLIGRDIIKTQNIREGDGKGRHTTTSRSLYVSRYGGLIIDTPGMRELQLGEHAEGLNTQFADVEELFLRCRFSNCQHQSEPNCAVKAAIADGSLSMERWQNYQKLGSEIRHSQRKQDKAVAALDKKGWKRSSVAATEKSRFKKRGLR